MEAASRSNPEDEAGASALNALGTVRDARAYAKACHQAAEKIFRTMSEDDINRPVESPFGTYPAWQYFHFAYDEHWHHRGQLYLVSAVARKGTANAVRLQGGGTVTHGHMSEKAQAGGLQPLHTVARVFAAFCFVLALLGLLSFWPPKSPAIVVWLLVWTMTCMGTGIAIVRRARHAPSLVWGLIVLASYGAISAFRSGLLGTVGILIDVLLFIPLIWFAIWYQRSRRTDAAATRPRTRSQWSRCRPTKEA